LSHSSASLSLSAKLRPDYRLEDEPNVFLKVEGYELHVFIDLIIGLDLGEHAYPTGSIVLVLGAGWLRALLPPQARAET
jgi:hypothetical protein